MTLFLTMRINANKIQVIKKERVHSGKFKFTVYLIFKLIFFSRFSPPKYISTHRVQK